MPVVLISPRGFTYGWQRPARPDRAPGEPVLAARPARVAPAAPVAAARKARPAAPAAPAEPVLAARLAPPRSPSRRAPVVRLPQRTAARLATQPEAAGLGLRDKPAHPSRLTAQALRLRLGVRILATGRLQPAVAALAAWSRTRSACRTSETRDYRPVIAA
jgi:hypothetical protein